MNDGCGVEVGSGVSLGVRVLVGESDTVAVIVAVGGFVAVGVGGSPVIVNVPEAFQVSPTKICTS